MSWVWGELLVDEVVGSNVSNKGKVKSQLDNLRMV